MGYMKGDYDYDDELGYVGNIWVTKDGANIPIRDIKLDHLINIHSMLTYITDRTFKNKYVGAINDVDYWWGAIDQEVKRRKIIQTIEKNRIVREQLVADRPEPVRKLTLVERVKAIEDYIQEL